MPAHSQLPFNVEIMNVNSAAFNALKPVTSLDYFEGATGNLHDEGLFSTLIFGRVGDPVRDKSFGYIPIKIQVFHPFLFRTIVQLRGLYGQIMAGKQHAIWDAKLKDFVPASEMDGRTGYAFFLEHWDKIELRANKSPVREQRIKLIQKYRDRALCNRILVMPAGLRDIEVEDDGRTTVVEINNLYRKVISTARTIPDSDYLNDPTYDRSRWLIQQTFNEIYDTIRTMLTGKSGFIQSKWGSRRIFNGTRNVITAMNVPIPVLGAPNVPKFTDTVVGLYQAAKGILPVALNILKTGYLQTTFSPGDNQAVLVNPKTLKAEIVTLPGDVHDRWNTLEGLEKVLTSMKDAEIRNRPVRIMDYYQALIYAPANRNVFRVFFDIDELPDGFDRKDVRPIKMYELLYLSGYTRWNNYAGFVTRYPVAGLGSTYPTTFYVKTTVRGEMRHELGDDWEMRGDEFLAVEFPTYEPLAYLDSLVIPSARLAGLVADFDGDTASANFVYSDEALREIKHMLRTKKAYADPRGGLMASINVDTVALVFRNFTRNPENP